MVLHLKVWESRTLPGLPSSEEKATQPNSRVKVPKRRRGLFAGVAVSKRRSFAAGWSSLVARQAHNLKVTGSNPVPATKSLAAWMRLGKFQSAQSSSTIRDPE